ncbi:MAG TPA: hypothetical protein VGK67_08440 [Myxococcales bacterium]
MAAQWVQDIRADCGVTLRAIRSTNMAPASRHRPARRPDSPSQRLP